MTRTTQYLPTLACYWRFDPAASPPEEELLTRLLADIERTGSIAAAARSVGMSYRNAWARVERWQMFFGRPLLVAARGKGSRLSPFAVRMLAVDARARRRLTTSLVRAGADMQREISGFTATTQIVIVASHDLALPILRDRLVTQGHQVDLQFRGSMEGLAALARNDCDVAGFHCPLGPLGARLWSRYRRYLKPRAHVLLQLARRRQGIMVQRGNPKRIRTLEDLARSGIRFLNRQPGAGTRLFLDLLLKDRGLNPTHISGYTSEEYTHAAVAAQIASGVADAGIGIEAAARRFHLGFVPLMEEEYMLAVRRDRLGQPPLLALVAQLETGEFRRQAAKLPGYDAEGIGRMRELKEFATRPRVKKKVAVKSR